MVFNKRLFAVSILVLVMLAAFTALPTSFCYALNQGSHTYKEYIADHAQYEVSAKVNPGDSSKTQRPTINVPDDDDIEDDGKDDEPLGMVILKGILMLLQLVLIMFLFVLPFIVVFFVVEKVKDYRFFKKHGIKRNGPEHKELILRQQLFGQIDRLQKHQNDD